jgi:G:T-mismatch repair DNA endonuclease (very short patch repair protein)
MTNTTEPKNYHESDCNGIFPCRQCGCQLGRFNLYENQPEKRIYVTNYFSEVPWVDVNTGVQYFRNLCIDCFVKQTGRFPNRPNVTNTDYMIMMEVPRISITNKSKSRAVTEKNMIAKYGQEEGMRRWNSYCQRQALTNTFEYKKEKYGMSKEEFDEYNLSRSCTIENFILRHGEKEGTEKWNEYVNRQSYTKSYEYFIEKFGDFADVEWKKNNDLKKLNMDNFTRKYGTEIGEVKFNEYLNNAYRPYSPISQEFFELIVNKLPDHFKFDENIMYAEANPEFTTHDKSTGKSFSYDFVIRNIKYAIEFNGEHCHPSPKLTEEEWKNWKCYQTKKTADEKHQEDVYKINHLKNMGFEVDVVWYGDFMKDQLSTTNYFVNKIIQIYNLKNQNLRFD